LSREARELPERTAEKAPDKSTPNEMRLISRVASILRTLSDHPSGMSFGQIAKETGLARATVQRVVGALRAEKLIVNGGLEASIRLGPEMARIAASVHRNITTLCRPIMERMNAVVKDTVDLTMLQENCAVVIDQVVAARALRVVSHIGTALPLHCTASGKAHLSQLDEQQAIFALRSPLRRYTQNTITNIKEITRLAATEEFFIDEEEFAHGVCAIAFPIRGLANGNYAIAVSLPKQHFETQRDSICKALLRCRNDIERVAGVR
jgi:IclR family transcriptional regulator, acetate operon repressor